MKTYFARLWAALLGRSLSADVVTVTLRVDTVHTVSIEHPTESTQGAPTDPGKPK